MSARYNKLHRIGKTRYNEKNDCSVIAVASTCNVSYGKAQAVLRRAGREDRKGASGTAIINAMKSLGFNVTVEEIKGSVITNARLTHGAAIILTASHASAVYDGELHDYEAAGRKRATHRLTVSAAT